MFHTKNSPRSLESLRWNYKFQKFVIGSIQYNMSPIILTNCRFISEKNLHLVIGSPRRKNLREPLPTLINPSRRFQESPKWFGMKCFKTWKWLQKRKWQKSFEISKGSFFSPDLSTPGQKIHKIRWNSPFKFTQRGNHYISCTCIFSK